MASKRERHLPPDLMSQKTTANPSAVPLESAAPAAVADQPPPAPGQEVEQPASEPAEVPAASPPQVAAPATQLVTKMEEQQAAAFFFPAPVHKRSVKQRSSQLSVQVPAKLYRIVNKAKGDIQGMTGQTILIEGLILWLLHNRFITPEEAAELLKEEV